MIDFLKGEEDILSGTIKLLNEDDLFLLFCFFLLFSDTLYNVRFNLSGLCMNAVWPILRRLRK